MASSLNSLPDWPMNAKLVSVATDSVQAQERLVSAMKAELKGQPHAEKALEEASQALDELRHLKSKIEGTWFKFQPYSIDRDKLAVLRHLVVAFTPPTLLEATKIKIAEKLTELFCGQIKKLVYACILTCPWFAAAQSEVSSQAKNNLLFVVFVSSDEQFFSLATPHEKELSETMDEGFLFATGVRHFSAQLQRGNVRALQALCAPPEAIVLCSPEWMELARLVDPVALQQKSFVEHCLGQAVGALVKKKKVRDRLVLRDDATLTKFSDSFRLLGFAECAVNRKPVMVWAGADLLVKGGAGEELKREGFQLLKEGFDGIVQKEKLLDVVMAWKEGLAGQMGVVPKRGPHWNEEMGHWLSRIRMDGVVIAQPMSPLPEEQSRLRDVFTSLGSPSLHPANVLAVAAAGSRMYGLATPTSDTDYIIVYRQPTQDMLSACTVPKESLDSRGQQREEELAAYEARLFCEMLLKGAVNIFELMYAKEMVYASEEWKALVAHKEHFMSEKVILQYIGYVQTHMSMITSGKFAGTPREGKVFYHIFHKLLSLEQFVHCQPPVVRCDGEERDFILRIRAGPLEGKFAKDELFALAKERLDAVRKNLSSRTQRFPEFGDYRILQTWLLSVRGVALKEPLRLATPPLTTQS